MRLGEASGVKVVPPVMFRVPGPYLERFGSPLPTGVVTSPPRVRVPPAVLVMRRPAEVSTRVALMVALRPGARGLTEMEGMVPARVRELAGLPWWSRSQPARVLVRRSPKRNFSRVRGESRWLVAPSARSRVVKLAVKPKPLAMVPSLQLAGALQRPERELILGAVLGGDGGGPDEERGQRQADDEAGGDLGGRAERSGKFDVSIHGEIFCARLFRVSSRDFGRLVTGWREGAS